MDSDEVRKRKEYAERKVKERHAALRKEAEERRKHAVEHRERVQSVLKREQVLLQKRMQQLNEDEERKKATLAKQHEATSRIAAITKSPKSFAFGSSTPRTLAYLDNLPKSEQQYDKKLRPLEDSSQVTSPTSTSSTIKMGRMTSTPQRPPPAAHRPAPAMTSMTSSMYVTSSAPPTRHTKTIVKSTTTTATSKRLSHGPSMMTQSVYTPTSRPATTTRLSMGAKPNRGTTPNSARLTQSITSTPVSTNSRRSLDTRKPPMPRKSTIGKQDPKKVEVVPDIPVVQEEQLSSDNTPGVVVHTASVIEEPVAKKEIVHLKENSPAADDLQNGDKDSEHTEFIENMVEVEETVEKVEDIDAVLDNSAIANLELIQTEKTADKFDDFSDNISNELTVKDLVSNEPVQNPDELISFKEIKESTTKLEAEDAPNPNDYADNANGIVFSIETTEESTKEPEQKIIEVEQPTEHVEKEELLIEETSESRSGSTANTSLADELVNIGVDQNDSHETPSKPEVIELEYPLLDERKKDIEAPTVSAANDLVDAFGNDFINQNRPQRMVDFDEDTDSGKASPTSSETSSTTDEVTPRSVIEEVKIAAPRVLPIVRSAEDMARKEKEAREAEERKNRLAAILAKSRGMASPMTNTLPPTATDIKDSTNSPVTSPPTPPSPLPVEQPSSSSANASAEEIAEKATNESGKANDVLARVAAMTNSSTLQKILQRKQGSNPSLQTSESTGGEIY